MSNGLTFEIRYLIINLRKFSGLLGFKKKTAFAKFEGNLFRIDKEICLSLKIMRSWLIIFNLRGSKQSVTKDLGGHLGFC